MRTNKLIIFLPLLLAMMLGLTGCSSDDETKSTETKTIERIGEVVLLKGVMHYNNILKYWFITYHEEGSIDSVIDYYPYKLKEEYKYEGMKVVFSGLVYKAEFDIPKIGGAQYYYIDLTYIERSN